MCIWFSASWRRFRYYRKCLFSCIYNPQITIWPTSLFSANFNGNRVKNHPKPWTCPLSSLGRARGLNIFSRVSLPWVQRVHTVMRTGQWLGEWPRGIAGSVQAEECRNVRREEGKSTAPTLDSATYNLRSFRPVALVTRVPGLVEMRADLHYSTPLGIRARLLT